MEKRGPYSERNLKDAKESISHAQGYADIGLEVYARGLNLPVSIFEGFRGMRVLDLGAGANLQFARGLEKAGIDADVVSFSPAFADERWAKEARPKTKKGIMAEKVVAGMGEHLPFADESFDRIVSLDVAEHLGSHERYLLYLKEIVRVLAPGGIAYIGPTVEMKTPHAARAIKREDLQELLNRKVDVNYHQSHRILKFQTMVLSKKDHA